MAKGKKVKDHGPAASKTEQQGQDVPPPRPKKTKSKNQPPPAAADPSIREGDDSVATIAASEVAEQAAKVGDPPTKESPHPKHVMRHDPQAHHDHPSPTLTPTPLPDPNNKGGVVEDTASEPLAETTLPETEVTSLLETGQSRRKVIKNLWTVCCNEVAKEREEFNSILTSLNLPTLHYMKDKTYPMLDYDSAPDLETSKGQDFLDFYVFPVLLPGIQALLQYAKDNQVFQVKLITFDAVDYLAQYLYNNNPRFPLRLEMPTAMDDIPFARDWLSRYPRPRPAKWMTMSKDEAARIIQRNVKGFLARVKPDIQEMRQFWEELRKEREAARMRKLGRGIWGSKMKMTMKMAAEIIQRAVRGFIVRKIPTVAKMRERWNQHRKQLELEDTRQQYAMKKRAEDQEQGDEDENHAGDHLLDPKQHEINLDNILDSDLYGDFLDDVHPDGDGDAEFDLTHSETCVICAKLREFIQIEEIKAELLAAKAAEEAALNAENEEEEDEEEDDEEEAEDEDVEVVTEIRQSVRPSLAGAAPDRGKRESGGSLKENLKNKSSTSIRNKTKTGKGSNKRGGKNLK